MEDLLEIREAAALVGRNSETVRRWVWSGRLPARRERNRLLVQRADLVALAGGAGSAMGLAEWAEQARAFQAANPGARRARSAADLVIEDRAARSR